MGREGPCVQCVERRFLKGHHLRRDVPTGRPANRRTRNNDGDPDGGEGGGFHDVLVSSSRSGVEGKGQNPGEGLVV